MHSPHVTGSTERIPAMPDVFASRIAENKRCYVMGILNCTEDSFYRNSRHPDSSDGLDAALGMVEDGADIIDIGGESTRPGAETVSWQEEADRVIPLIKALRKKSGVLISIDTSKAEVARQAALEGADIINDITALGGDPHMPEVAAQTGKALVLMHMQGTPSTMQINPHYENCVKEIIAWLEERIQFAQNSGIAPENIIIDPGIGFGKRLRDNLDILKRLDEFMILGRPLLMGLSRKSFIGTVLNRQKPEDRLTGTIAANIYSFFKGARILRVHDVKETVDSINMIYAIEGNAGGLV